MSGSDNAASKNHPFFQLSQVYLKAVRILNPFIRRVRIFALGADTVHCVTESGQLALSLFLSSLRFTGLLADPSLKMAGGEAGESDG